MRTILVLFFSLFSFCVAVAQVREWEFREPLDSLLAAKDPGMNNPGFAVCIIEHGRIVYERQFGLANLEQRKPVTATTTFNIGSVTKQFTAACILLLEEQGKLRRSDPVQKYIPELPDFGRPVTLDHLISHTSGLYGHIDVLNLRYKYKNSRLSPSAIFHFYQKSPALSFAPGTDFIYNNTAYQLLSIVIERVSELSTGDFMKKNIFEPLGMQHARFCLIEAEGLTDGTVSYAFEARKKRYKKTDDTHNMLGATGVHCTLRDLALWQNNFAQNRLGKGDPALIRRMETTYTLNDGTPVHYGAGLVLKDYRGIPTVEHGGGWNSFLLQCRRFPDRDISVLVASNNDQSNPFTIADAICDKLFSFKQLPEKQTPDPVAIKISMKDLEGKYLSSNNRLRYVRYERDTLKIAFDEAPKKAAAILRFDPLASSDTALVFNDVATGYPVVFSILENGAVQGLYWEGGDYFQCRRFYEKLHPIPVSPGRWIGQYKSDDFGQKIRIRRYGKSGGLKLKPVFFMGYPLEPITGSIYKVRGEHYIVRFSAHGIVLGDEWVANLRFKRKYKSLPVPSPNLSW